uniref:Putative ribonuclease H-like domain-containing protein n=1 Tax=Tanacetum cinerariifolium TaxID=118510 RepID=A0A6L2KT14_TANCI|nr:putative ribonuclease H-like domain-containing protein [Tanacetum cinerariifolium]
MVIKSKTEQEMIIDIAETFDNLRRINMKLNPKKCSFGVEEGKFLGYIVTSEGIRANPKKMKAVLADFINEIPIGVKHVEICISTDEEAIMEEWTLYTDGASSLKGVGAGLVLIDPAGVEYTYAIRRLNFPNTNNEAEYEALLARLLIAQKMKVRPLKVKVDSKLVACQLNGEFVASSEGMPKYLTKSREHVTLFKKFSIENIPRNQNQKAGVLSKMALVAFNNLTKEVLLEVLNAKLVDA